MVIQFSKNNLTPEKSQSVMKENTSRLRQFWIVFKTEFQREFFTKRTIGITGIFAVFTALIIFIVTDNFDQLKLTQPDINEEYWSYQLALGATGFFAGIIGIAVASYLGVQFLTKDIEGGSIRLLTSTPTERSTLYLARSFNAVVQYLPLSIAAGATVITAGTLVGLNKFDISFAEIQGFYFKTLFTSIFIIFLVGFLATTLANLFGIITGNETQGIIFAIMILVFGDLIIFSLAGISPDIGLENLAVGYHETRALEFLLQVKLDGGAFGSGELEPSSGSVAFPWLSMGVLLLLPLFLLYIGYIVFNRKDLD